MKEYNMKLEFNYEEKSIDDEKILHKIKTFDTTYLKGCFDKFQWEVNKNINSL